MPWLLRDREVLASVEIPRGALGRARGVLGRDRIDGVVLLRSVSVHTVGVRLPIDVAFCCAEGPLPRRADAPWELRVSTVRTVPPRRMTRPRWRDRVVLEASAGTFEHWGVRPGDRLRVR